MKRSNSPDKEVIGDQLIEEISQLKQLSLGVGAAVCQVCGAELVEGDALVAYAFRPAGCASFDVGHVKCISDRHEPTECFTLGVRELVVEGRVGWCSDAATQSSWPVLLAPRPLVVSPADTTGARPLLGVSWVRRGVGQSESFVAADRRGGRRPWERAVRRADAAGAARVDGGDAGDARDAEKPRHCRAAGKRGER